MYARALGTRPDDLRKLCNFAVTIHYEDAVANVIFNESAGDGFPRERVQALSSGQVSVLDDFATLTVHGKKTRSIGRKSKRQMGHKQALAEFVKSLRGEPNQLLTWEEAARASLCTFAAQESIRSGEPVDLRSFRDRLLSTPEAE